MEGVVDLVGDDQEVVLFRHGGDVGQLFGAKRDSGGVRRTVDQDRLRARRDELLQLGCADAEVRVGVQEHGLSAADPDEVTVDDKVGVGHDDFVSIVNENHERLEEAPGAATRDERFSTLQAEAVAEPDF